MRRLAFILLLASASWAQSAPAPQSPTQSSSAPQSGAPAAERPLPRHDEQLVVTGSPDAIPLEESDRSVNSIPVGGSPTVYRNWADALQQDPSLDVEQRTPGTSADISIRGSSFGETLILVNGLRLNDSQTGHNNLDIPFPFESVERVEVLKGSGSTLYGSDAMGGAVNFITAPPAATEIRLGAAAGNWGTNQQTGALSLARKRFTEQLSFVRELSTGFITNRDYRNLAVASESGFHTALGSSDILLGLSDRPYGAQGFYGDYPSWERGKGWLAAWTQPLGKQSTADFAYRRHSDEFILFRSNPALYENNHISEAYQASARRYEKLSETMRIYYGADALRESIDSSNLGHHRRDQAGLYASFDARALRRFSLNLGAREELYTGGRQVFSPSLSGAYWVSASLKLRASASHAFRLPTYTDLYYTDPANLGNPNLKPESAWSFEGGAQWAIRPGLTLEGDLFHRRDRDVIDYVRASALAPYQAENIHNLSFTGVELMARWQLARGERVELAYTGMHGAGDTLAGLQSKYVFRYPIHSGNATWWCQLRGIESRFRLSAVERRGTGAYPLVEWTVGRQFEHWKPYVQMTNLTDTKYQEIPGVPLPGRGFLAGLELRWRAH